MNKLILTITIAIMAVSCNQTGKADKKTAKVEDQKKEVKEHKKRFSENYIH